MRIPFFCIALFFSLQSISQSEAKNYLLKADNFRKNQQSDSAIFYYRKSGNTYLKSDSIPACIDAWNQAGVILTRMDRYTEAREILDSALTLGVILKGEESLVLASTYICLGVIYNAEENYDQSLQNHLAALSIRLTYHGDYHADVATSYGNLGNVFLNMKFYHSALFYHSKAREVRDSLFGSESAEIAQSYLGLGNTYREMGQYDSAILNFEKVLMIRMKIKGNNHKDLIPVYEKLSQVYLLDKDTEKAKYYQNLADTIKSQTGN
jgi:tetratricopeptide (TPR) repeat protein